MDWSKQKIAERGVLEVLYLQREPMTREDILEKAAKLLPVSKTLINKVIDKALKGALDCGLLERAKEFYFMLDPDIIKLVEKDPELDDDESLTDSAQSVDTSASDSLGVPDSSAMESDSPTMHPRALKSCCCSNHYYADSDESFEGDSDYPVDSDDDDDYCSDDECCGGHSEYDEEDYDADDLEVSKPTGEDRKGHGDIGEINGKRNTSNKLAEVVGEAAKPSKPSAKSVGKSQVERAVDRDRKARMMRSVARKVNFKGKTTKGGKAKADNHDSDESSTNESEDSFLPMTCPFDCKVCRAKIMASRRGRAKKRKQSSTRRSKTRRSPAKKPRPRTRSRSRRR